jgi:hypothetical protein
MKFAKRLFLFSGVYGIIALAPQYFMEQKNNIDFPPPITHPEYFYGFVGVGLAWQFLFLIIGKDPVRFRPAMIPGALEKIGFGLAAIVLFLNQRVTGFILTLGCVDLVFAALFLLAYAKTPASQQA